MNPSDSPDSQEFSLLDFSRQEIKGQTSILQEAIAGFHDPLSLLPSAEKATKCAQEIIQLLAIHPLTTLIPLMENVESFLQKVQEGFPISPEQIEMLGRVLEELKGISIIEKIQLKNTLQTRKELFDEFTIQFQKFVEGSDTISSDKTKKSPAKEKKKELEHPSKKTKSIQSKPSLPTPFAEGPFDPTMFDLFRVDLEEQSKILNEGLIEIEQRPSDPNLLESLMRAAHSIKGAARVVNLNPIVRLAHVMEDCFVAAQKQHKTIPTERVDQLLHGVDLFVRLSKIQAKGVSSWCDEQIPSIELVIGELTSRKVPKISKTKIKKDVGIKKVSEEEKAKPQLPLPKEIKLKEEAKKAETKTHIRPFAERERVLRITAEHLNHLMGLAGESLVESRWLHPFGQQLQEFKNQLREIEKLISLLRETTPQGSLNEVAQHSLADATAKLHDLRSQVNDRLGDLDDFIRRHAHLSDQLYQEVIDSRMRPFADGVGAFPRMVRDLARELGKQVKLVIEGKSTSVDRDILESSNPL